MGRSYSPAFALKALLYFTNRMSTEALLRQLQIYWLLKKRLMDQSAPTLHVQGTSRSTTVQACTTSSCILCPADSKRVALCAHGPPTREVANLPKSYLHQHGPQTHASQRILKIPLHSNLLAPTLTLTNPNCQH